MSEITDLSYYQKNKDLILNKKKITIKIIDRLREQARDKYKSLSEEESKRISKKLSQDKRRLF